MTAASLVAFVLVFLGASVALSAVLCGTVLALRPALRRMGPWVERRATAAALVLPPSLALVLVVVLAAGSSLAIANGTDHCVAHDHHMHLCLVHGAEWASLPWALAVVVAAITFVLVRAGLSLWAHAIAQRSADRLKKLGEPLGKPACYLVPARERFAFTAGLVSPVVLLSTATWAQLEPDQREAVLEHELGHVAHRDLRRRAVLGLLATFGVPVLTSRVLDLWALAAERICDRRAAAAVGRPSTVASAILALARTPPSQLAPAGAVFAAASNVPARIRSILDDEPGGEHRSRFLVRLAWAVAVLLALACASFAEPIHHALETLLG